MSAPNTNLDKQGKRHKGSLFGMATVLTFAGVLFVGFLIWTSYQSSEPAAESPVEVLGSE